MTIEGQSSSELAERPEAAHFSDQDTLSAQARAILWEGTARDGEEGESLVAEGARSARERPLSAVPEELCCQRRTVGPLDCLDRSVRALDVAREGVVGHLATASAVIVHLFHLPFDFDHTLRPRSARVVR